MSSTNTTVYQAVLTLLRRGFGYNDITQLLGGMSPEDQASLMEGIRSTIELSIAEATAASTAAHEMLEEQLAQITSNGRNFEDFLRVARDTTAALEEQASAMSNHGHTL
ncbi:hypothetical protein DYB37_012196 [Aphanomyces astaci]|uniref:Uncharacterized protein n=2 Tax=Aphanomyces astaci TaxID=112090 RepID=A0A397CF60_APHAT|nr:hypothetical protein DYB25_013620 [Aphanomyces astaci]RHY44653.1 hypothetical protein DYB30_012587 [Aphanomyces astaci]RHY63650.1 hypothetical protein DYB34_006229 [Aphanomyces astaci]RHY92457.1 hypothetical protein DYB35_010760 [Aphanomyces astaci]RHZ06630.1 hypothetical protein DYB26_010340 [Aphanomyces astaci]